MKSRHIPLRWLRWPVPSRVLDRWRGGGRCVSGSMVLGNRRVTTQVTGPPSVPPSITRIVPGPSRYPRINLRLHLFCMANRPGWGIMRMMGPGVIDTGFDGSGPRPPVPPSPGLYLTWPPIPALLYRATPCYRELPRSPHHQLVGSPDSKGLPNSPISRARSIP